jgi:signal transduction histidine kinase
MTRKSLRLRLAVTAAMAIGLALAIAWAGLSLLFERHLERQAQADLERLGGVLAAGVGFDAAGAPLLSGEPSDPRFQTPGSGLYWRLSSPAGTLASRSLWDGALPSEAARSDIWTAAIGQGPFEDEVMQVARLIRPTAEGAPVLVQVAADHASLDAAQAAFAGELALSLTVLWAVLLAAAGAQTFWGLQPLAEVRQALQALKADPAARLDADRFPAEVAPLAEQINTLASARAADMARARSRAQDLAHALKTPLTALKLQIADVPAAKRAEFERSVALLQQAIGAELAANASPAGAGAATAIKPLIDRLIAVIGRARADRGLNIANACDPSHQAPMVQDGALELFGALIDNAAKHAETKVRISSAAVDGKLVIAVDDDGPGIPEDQIALALQRGGRLDQRTGGHGLGLAIASDLAVSAGGVLELTTSPLTGLCARVSWPLGQDHGIRP